MARRSLTLNLLLLAEYPGVKSRLPSSKLCYCKLGTRYSRQLHRYRCNVRLLDKNHARSGLLERRLLQLQHIGSYWFLLEISGALK